MNASSSVQCRYPYSKIYAEINIPYQCIFPPLPTHPTFFELQIPEPMSQDQPPSPQPQLQMDLSAKLAPLYTTAHTINSSGRGRLSGSLTRHRSIKTSSP